MYLNECSIPCIKIKFNNTNAKVKSRDAIAYGTCPASMECGRMRLIEPFEANIECGKFSPIQYLAIDDNYFEGFKVQITKDYLFNINETIIFTITQMLLQNKYTLNTWKLPELIILYPCKLFEDNIKCYYPDYVKYIDNLEPKINLHDNNKNFEIDKILSYKLDKLANILFEISLNKAIMNIFKNFTSLENNDIFGLLYEHLKNNKTAVNNAPSEDFMDKLYFLSSSYKEAKQKIAQITGKTPKVVDNINLKNMELFLFLSQSFGYNIDKNLKNNFKIKINKIISILKSVLSIYPDLEIISQDFAISSYNISSLVNIISSSKPNNNVEYSGKILSDNNLLSVITENDCIIGYNENYNDTEYYVDKFNARLMRYMEIDNIEYSANEFIRDNILADFRLLYNKKDDDYAENQFDNIAENSLCYFNLARIFEQVLNSQYPNEYNKQIIISKIQEILPFINTVFCDIPKIF